MKSRNLILVRHGQSEWNAKNLFTGWKDPGLTDRGVSEAKNAGKLILEQEIEFLVPINLFKLSSNFLTSSPIIKEEESITEEMALSNNNLCEEYSFFKFAKSIFIFNFIYIIIFYKVLFFTFRTNCISRRIK